MPLARTAELVAAGHRAGHGVGAFNVICLEHAEAIVTGAERAGRPVILQISENTVAYHGSALRPLALASTAIAEAAAVPVSLHLDHATGEQLCRDAVELGFSSLMYDASTLPYEQNVATTAALASWVQDRGGYVEAELGVVGGKGGAHAPGARTDPDEAVDFVNRTGVDALAVAVGTSHAMTQRSARIDIDLVRKLRNAIAVPLVLHGSSGAADDLLAAAVAAGITKVNVATQLNQAMTGRIRAVLSDDPGLVDPRKYLVAARADIADVVHRLLTLLSPLP
jgi:fructose-bisphosphate aldolase class II